MCAYPDAPALWETPSIEATHEPVLTMHIVKDAVSLRLFTTLATLDTAHDVTPQDIRIECFFPADAATDTVFKDWARERS